MMLWLYPAVALWGLVGGNAFALTVVAIVAALQFLQFALTWLYFEAAVRMASRANAAPPSMWKAPLSAALMCLIAQLSEFEWAAIPAIAHAAYLVWNLHLWGISRTVR